MSFNAFCPAFLEATRQSIFILDEDGRYFFWKGLLAACGGDQAAVVAINRALGSDLFPPPYPNTGDTRKAMRIPYVSCT